METLQKPLPTDPGRDVRRAWWSLALYVPSFVLAFVVGEGLMSAFGYESGEDVPVWVYAAAGMPACLVFALPLLVTVPLSRHAARAGRRDAWMPVWIGSFVAGIFLLQNLASLALTLLVD
ncbi:hypothetical protein [Nocardioides taihuensis]|uniref:Uncharacterized protein n=1 Tax=Nocardioides taihuensis TaxID=1835606 RepID=A0ABW0BIH6_9ACTN